MDNVNINLETLQQSCRICLQKGEINIWDFKVNISNDFNETFTPMEDMDVPATTRTETSGYVSALDLIEVFGNTTDILELSEEFPLLCWQCLEDFRLCYLFHNKLQNASKHLKKIYSECLNQSIEEEHLIELPENESKEYVIETYTSSVGPINEEEIPDNIIEFPAVDELLHTTSKVRNKRPAIRCRSLDANSSFVVSQFVPSTLAKTDEDDEELQPFHNLRTVDCKAVEVKDVSQLESLDGLVVLENENLTETPAVYLCQYCPQAFAKSEFLKTHIQKTHVCFCTQPFQLATDLYRHIREVHNEHRCVICQKIFSSNTNLRHHIKRIHRINLPAKMTLLDFIHTAEEDRETDDTKASITRIDEDGENSADQFDTSIYFLKTNDVKISNPDNMEMN